MLQNQKIKDYLLKHISRHPHDIVAIAANHFNVTRTTIHRHLTALLNAHEDVKFMIQRGISRS